jgi:hypothetical protein
MMRSVYDLEAREEIVFGLLGLRDRVLLKLLSIQVILLSISLLRYTTGCGVGPQS